MPRVEIKPKYSLKPDEPNENVWDLPDEDGEYKLPDGSIITVEMNPEESAQKGLQFIAVTSLLFKGHERTDNAGNVSNYFGKERRLVVIGKRGFGSVLLSSGENLRVTLNSALQGKKPLT